MTRRELSDDELVAGMIATAADAARNVIDSADRAKGWVTARAQGRRPPEQAGDRKIVDGVLVPLDAWRRVLDQLGRLHEVGRELAEARERAARAETEARLLRERATHAETECRLLQERLGKLREQMAATVLRREYPPALSRDPGSRVEATEEPAAAEALRRWFRRRDGHLDSDDPLSEIRSP